MKIRIDQQNCAGHARCAAVAPEVYRLDDDGYIALAEIDVPDELLEKARRGARACPERVIVAEE